MSSAFRRRRTASWLVTALLFAVAVTTDQFVPPSAALSADVRATHNMDLYGHARVDGAPVWFVFLCAFAVPLAVFAQTSPRLQLERKALGLSLCLAVVFLGTAALKKFVGAPRPNFFSFFDDDADHTAPLSSSQWEAVQSFPSGHSSMAFGGLSFLARDIAAGRRRRASESNPVITVVLVLLPLILAGFIAAGRIVDHWHFAVDVVAGALIGVGASGLVHTVVCCDDDADGGDEILEQEIV